MLGRDLFLIIAVPNFGGVRLALDEFLQRRDFTAGIGQDGGMPRREQDRVVLIPDRFGVGLQQDVCFKRRQLPEFAGLDSGAEGESESAGDAVEPVGFSIPAIRGFPPASFGGSLCPK